MKLPLQIRVQKVSASDVVMDDIRKKAAGLDEFSRHIMACRVTVDSPPRHKHLGMRYNVHIDLTLPGEEIVIKRQAHEDIYVALRDAFDAARRKLEEYERKRRGVIKVHEAAPHGRVIRLFPEKGYGFLESPDGLEIYFHRNSVLHAAFDRLAVGTPVRFIEEIGEKGPQASTVEIVHPHRRSRTQSASTRD
ncbi:MAG TPA: HPF/RaiA family ribosome-associated protein [Nitrospiria bacterium]|nr:HPF/RaiA family ribosome-associated protein [Nitrospiria bacterium]